MLLARSVLRVAVVAGVIATSGLVWADFVAAAGKEINATIDPGKCDKTWGPPCFTPANGTVTQINQGETVTWKALDGTHTVSPADGSAFAGSGDLAGPDATFSVTFDKPGSYSFYCKHHGSVEDGGKIHHGMWGKIDVKAATNTTAAPPPPSSPPPDPGPPPSTGPAHPPSPPPSSSPPPATSNGSTAPPNSSNQGGQGQTAAGSGRPWVGPPPTAAPPASSPAPRVAASPAPAPADSESQSKGKDKDGGGNADPAAATAVPPDDAVLPPSPQFPTATTAPLAEPTGETPQGDTVALIKNEPAGHRRKLVMIITLAGMGAFAGGVGGWKFMHRSSKYWPA
jgi:plastocyanin